MKKVLAYVMMCLWVGMNMFVMSSCSSDDEDGGSVSNASDLLVGEWHCTQQIWVEDGEKDSETYEPSSAYSMKFNAPDKKSKTGQGYMISGSDQLFEIKTYGKKKTFTWCVSEIKGRNYVVTDVYDGEEYRIDKLNVTELQMTWTDDDLSITCVFKKVG